MNIELLNRIQQKILADPTSFQMETFFAPPWPEDDCDTAACIAGWTLLLSGKNKACDVAEEAAKVLGITLKQAALLFYEGGWPEKFRLRSKVYSDKAAQLAADRIDHFIATDGQE